jgi:signal transduction histidine kinase
LLAGLAVVSGSIPIVVQNLRGAEVGPREAFAWALLFPMLGLTGGFASRVWRAPSAEGLNVLIEANRVLSSLYRIARTLPGGLEIGSVAEATMHEIRDAIGARAGAMLLQDAGNFAVVGSFGLADPGGVLVREGASGLGAAIHGEARLLKREGLHPATVASLGDFDCWLASPMRRDGIPQGLLLAACPDEGKHDENGSLLRRLADESAVAVENARLFSRVREISIDEERRRLARELHDGIAQSLTHLRYELDFMARHGGGAADPMRRDIQRLSRVVERTSADVRSMILGLRASVADQGLIGALRSYLADLQRLGGPSMSFDARGEVRLPGDIEGEIFRVAQEAVSNALRHANATTISVRLISGATQVRLTVEDDGVGLRGSRRSKTGGIGLDAMRERAELIGAHFAVGPRESGGTMVLLEYAVGEKP